MAKVSIIIPVYKAEAYLRRCLDSICAQTFADFEVIAINDGSPDDSLSILREYEAKDSRFIVLTQENRGVAAARNAGLDWIEAHSDSEWISWIDSDDWVHPDYLKELYQANIENGTDISRTYSQDVKTEAEVKPNRKEMRVSTISPEEAYFSWRFGMYAVLWGHLYRRKLFDGMRMPMGCIYEDVAIAHKLLFATERISVVNHELYYYYDNINSITHADWTSQKLDAIDIMEANAEFFYTAGKKSMYKKFSFNYGIYMLWERTLLHYKPSPTLTAEEIQRYGKWLRKKFWDFQRKQRKDGMAWTFSNLYILYQWILFPILRPICKKILLTN